MSKKLEYNNADKVEFFYWMENHLEKIERIAGKNRLIYRIQWIDDHGIKRHTEGWDLADAIGSALATNEYVKREFAK